MTHRETRPATTYRAIVGRRSTTSTTGAHARATQYEITTDGTTVWVHGIVGGRAGCLGRFGKNGIDVHRPPGNDIECLFCTHAVTMAADWSVFVAKLAEHYGIVVGDNYRPDRFKK